MENAKTYSIPVVVEKEVEIDFKKVYDVLRAEYPNDDIYYLGDTFGDNLSYYIKRALNVELPDNEEIEDLIWSDFYEWLEHNVK